MVNTILEIFLFGLSILSVVTGVIGLRLTLKCKMARIRHAIISVQIVAVLLAIVHAVLQLTKGLSLEYTMVIYLALNSSFLLLVQIVALMAVMPKDKEVEPVEDHKARVKVKV